MRLKLILGLVAIAIPVTTGIAVATSDGNPYRALTHAAAEAHPAARASAGSMRSRDQRRFSALKSPSVVPRAVKRMLADFAPARSVGANPALAHGVTVGALTSEAYIWPGAGWICLFLPDPVDGGGVSCQPDRAAAAGRLLLSLRDAPNPDSGPVVVVGVVPDGVDSVVVRSRLPDATTKASVKDNIYAANVTDPAAVTFADPEIGTVEVPVP